jgi:hypothetical protein
MEEDDSSNNAIPEISKKVFILALDHRLFFSVVSNAYHLEHLENRYDLSTFAGNFLGRCNGEDSTAYILNELSLRYPLPDFVEDMIAFINDAERMGWIIEVNG